MLLCAAISGRGGGSQRRGLSKLLGSTRKILVLNPMQELFLKLLSAGSVFH